MGALDPDQADLRLWALHDALCLLRAVHDGDPGAIEKIAGSMAAAELTAVQLAVLLDDHLRVTGDRIEVIDAWRERTGL